MWRGRTLVIIWVCPPAILRAPINARTSSVYGILSASYICRYVCQRGLALGLSESKVTSQTVRHCARVTANPLLQDTITIAEAAKPAVTNRRFRSEERR